MSTNSVKQDIDLIGSRHGYATDVRDDTAVCKPIK